MHGDVKGQGVLVGVPVRRKGQRVQLKVIVVPDIVLVIVEHGVVQVAVVQLVIPGVVVGIVSVGIETAVIVKVVIVGELHVFQFVVIRLVVEEIVEILRVQRHIVVRVHLIGQVALAAGAAALADLDVQGAVHLVAVHAAHGEVKGQGVRVGVPVGVERQRVQFKVIVVPDVVLVVIEHGIVQIAVIELIVQDIVIAVVSVCAEISEVIEIIVAGELHILQLVIAAVFLVKEIPEVLGVHRHIVAGVHLVGQLHITGAGAGTALHINADRCVKRPLVAVQPDIKIQRVAVDVVIGHKPQRVQVDVVIVRVSTVIIEFVVLQRLGIHVVELVTVKVLECEIAVIVKVVIIGEFHIFEVSAVVVLIDLLKVVRIQPDAAVLVHIVRQIRRGRGRHGNGPGQQRQRQQTRRELFLPKCFHSPLSSIIFQKACFQLLSLYM